MERAMIARRTTADESQSNQDSVLRVNEQLSLESQSKKGDLNDSLSSIGRQKKDSISAKPVNLLDDIYNYKRDYHRLQEMNEESNKLLIEIFENNSRENRNNRVELLRKQEAINKQKVILISEKQFKDKPDQSKNGRP